MDHRRIGFQELGEPQSELPTSIWKIIPRITTHNNGCAGMSWQHVALHDILSHDLQTEKLPQ